MHPAGKGGDDYRSCGGLRRMLSIFQTVSERGVFLPLLRLRDWRIARNPHSELNLALRQAIWRKEEPRWIVCGIPDVLYTDNGSDFTSQLSNKWART
jgi:hypothetical protein